MGNLPLNSTFCIVLYSSFSTSMHESRNDSVCYARFDDAVKFGGTLAIKPIFLLSFEVIQQPTLFSLYYYQIKVYIFVLFKYIHMPHFPYIFSERFFYLKNITA